MNALYNFESWLLEKFNLGPAPVGNFPAMEGKRRKQHLSPLALTTKCIVGMLLLGAPLILKLDQYEKQIVLFRDAILVQVATSID